MLRYTKITNFGFRSISIRFLDQNRDFDTIQLMEGSSLGRDKDLICNNENVTETGSNKTDDSKLLDLVLMTSDRSKL